MEMALKIAVADQKKRTEKVMEESLCQLQEAKRREEVRWASVGKERMCDMGEEGSISLTSVLFHHSHISFHW